MSQENQKQQQQVADENTKKLTPSASEDQSQTYSDPKFNDDLIDQVFPDMKEETPPPVNDEAPPVEQKEEEATKEEEIEEEIQETTEPAKPAESQAKEITDQSGQLKALQEKNAVLESEIAGLKSQIAELSKIKEVVSGVVGENKDVDVVGYFQQLHEVNQDLTNNPVLLNTIDSLHKGEVPEAFQGNTKTVNDFMPEGLEFDISESMQVPNSASFIAREQFEAHRLNLVKSRDQLVQSFKEGRGKGESGQFPAKIMEKVNSSFSNVKTFATEHYDQGEQLFEGFVKAMSNYDEDLLKAVFAVHARRNGHRSKVVKAIEENKNKVSLEANSNQSQESYSDLFDIKKEQDEIGNEFFSDWQN